MTTEPTPTPETPEEKAARLKKEAAAAATVDQRKKLLEKPLFFYIQLPLGKTTETVQQQLTRALQGKATTVNTRAALEAKDITKDLPIKKEALKKDLEKKIALVDQKIILAPEQEKPELYLVKEQLKEEYDADQAELDQENIQDLKDLEEELKQDQEQLKAEYMADVAVLRQEGPEALQQLEKEKYTPTPEGQAFARWAEERSKMTEDEIFDLEAESQGLIKQPEPSADYRPTPEGQAFAAWAEERSKMTEDEIFALEAESQGLVEKPEAAAAPKKPVAAPPARPTVKPELIIKRINYPKWWRDGEVAKISLTTPGTQVVFSGRGGFRTYVSSITLTVDGETDITLGFGIFGASGSLNLGGEGQPMGITINMGESPAPCGEGGFSVSGTEAGVYVGGFVVYYREKE